MCELKNMNMKYTIKDAGNGWSDRYKQTGVAWPSENVIRIFKGTYPRLNLRQHGYAGKKVIDVGCGDVGNLLFFETLGLELYGIEIDQKIVNQVHELLQVRGVNADIRLGKNDRLPYGNELFDYLLSWNAAYYMGAQRDFSKNVIEFARVLKPGAHLIMSVPKVSHEIFNEAKIIDNEFAMIQVDRLGIRVGEVFRRFRDTSDIEKTFSSHFKDFAFGSVEDDYFGVAGHWHLVVCEKK